MATVLKPIMKYSSGDKNEYQKCLDLYQKYEVKWGILPIEPNVLKAKIHLGTLLTLYSNVFCNN